MSSENRAADEKMDSKGPLILEETWGEARNAGLG